MIFGRKKKKEVVKKTDHPTENIQSGEEGAEKTAPPVPAPTPTAKKPIAPEELKPVRTFEEDLAEAIAKRDEIDEENREQADVKKEVVVAKKELSESKPEEELDKEAPETPAKIPVEAPEATPKKEVTHEDPRIAVEKKLADIATQKETFSKQIAVLEDQERGAKGVVEKFTQEKNTLDLALAPIKDQEIVVEESVVEIEKQEVSAPQEERRSLEEHRWELESERKKLESRKWEINKEVEEIENSIRKSEATHAEIQNKKEAAVLQLKDLAKQEKRIHLKRELDRVSNKKQELELEWMKFNSQFKEQEALLRTTTAEEENTQNQKKGIEEKEHSAESSQEERGFEEARWEVEGKLKELEEKRWTLEKTLGETKDTIAKLKPAYQEALAAEENLNKELANLDLK